MNLSSPKGIESNSRTYTILVIDDNSTNLGVIADYLETHGLNVLAAQDGEDGLKKAQLTQPNLILLDVILPGIDGFETCRRLQADVTTQNIPVILMTVLTDTEHKLKGFQAGAVDYVTKPFQKDEVLARITTQLHLRELTEQLEQKVQERTIDLVATNKQLRQEVTERKTVEVALEKTVFLQTMAQQIAKLGSWEWHFDSNIMSWSPEMYGIWGIHHTDFPDGVPLEKALEHIHPDDFERIEAANEHVLKTGVTIPTEYRIVQPDGNVRWVFGDGKLILDADGEPTSLVGVIQDITERKQAEKTLQESEENFALHSQIQMWACAWLA